MEILFIIVSMPALPAVVLFTVIKLARRVDTVHERHKPVLKLVMTERRARAALTAGQAGA